MSPRAAIFDGNADGLRKPLAEGKTVVRTKSSALPLLIGKDGTDDYDPQTWQVGAKVKALIAFYPYEVNLYTGISANLRLLGLVKESEEASLKDIAEVLLSSSDSEEAE